MKLNWQDVKMPAGIEKRPRDNRGFPVTFVTLIDSNGRPDFTTIDGTKIVRCITEGLCGLCGESWPGSEIRSDDHLYAFIGGPLACSNRNFLDPPMHVACAEYAMQVCPHIATPTARYAKPNLGGPEQRQLFEGVSSDRPAKFGLYVTDNYEVINYLGQPVFMANQPTDITWSEE